MIAIFQDANNVMKDKIYARNAQTKIKQKLLVACANALLLEKQCLEKLEENLRKLLILMENVVVAKHYIVKLV